MLKMAGQRTANLYGANQSHFANWHKVHGSSIQVLPVLWSPPNNACTRQGASGGRERRIWLCPLRVKQIVGRFLASRAKGK